MLKHLNEAPGIILILIVLCCSVLYWDVLIMILDGHTLLVVPYGIRDDPDGDIGYIYKDCCRFRIH